MDHSSIFSIALMLFLIIDPVGNIASYLTLMSDVEPKRRNLVLFREMGIALVFMLLANFLGEYIFDLLGISRTTVFLASGVILFLIAIKILFPTQDSFRANLPKGEPFIVPLAIPLTAGPSLLATIMLYASLEPNDLIMVAAIFAALIAATFVLFVAPGLKRILKSNGLLALEKLMGMVLVLLAVQRLAEGVQLFLKGYYS